MAPFCLSKQTPDYDYVSLNCHTIGYFIAELAGTFGDTWSSEEP